MNNKMRLSVYFMVMGMVILLATVYTFSEEVASGNVERQAVSAESPKESVAVTPNTEAAKAAASAMEAMSAVTSAVTTAPSATTEETKWLWAEITAVDPVTNQFTVKYLSYDSDEEKELTLSVDSATQMENFKSLSEMAAGDNVSVDYVEDLSGKATTKSISLQKAKPVSAIPETASVSEPMPASVTEVTTAAPETAAPTVTAPAVVTNTETATSAAEQK